MMLLVLFKVAQVLKSSRKLAPSNKLSVVEKRNYGITNSSIISNRKYPITTGSRQTVVAEGNVKGVNTHTRDQVPGLLDHPIPYRLSSKYCCTSTRYGRRALHSVVDHNSQNNPTPVVPVQYDKVFFSSSRNLTIVVLFKLIKSH